MQSTNKHLQAAIKAYTRLICDSIDRNRYISGVPYISIVIVWLHTTPTVHTYYRSKHTPSTGIQWPLPTIANNPENGIGDNYVHNVYINCRLANQASVLPWG